MCSYIGFTLEDAVKDIKKRNLQYKIIEYNSRFKDGIDTDSLRIVRQRQIDGNIIELTVSDFKTAPSA